MDTLEAFRRAKDEFNRAVETADGSQWGGPTPCSEWDVRTLVNHVTGEMLWAPPLVDGKTVEDVGDQFDGDILGDDPVATWHKASDEALASFSAPGALEQTVHLSFGDYSGDDYAWQLIGDLHIHSWDLARGVGADDTLADDLSQAVYDALAPMLTAMGETPYFAKATDVGADASASNRLLALTGRRP